MRSIEELLRLAQQILDEAEENAEANPTSEHIQVVIVEPMKKPYKKTIKNELGKFNDIVGGYIENVFIGHTDTGAKLGVVINEDGIRLDLPFNRRIVGRYNLLGNMCITAYNYEGDNVSLTNDQADQLINQFSSTRVYL